MSQSCWEAEPPNSYYRTQRGQRPSPCPCGQGWGLSVRQTIPEILTRPSNVKGSKWRCRDSADILIGRWQCEECSFEGPKCGAGTCAVSGHGLGWFLSICKVFVQPSHTLPLPKTPFGAQDSQS